jgi:pimeloyl-ACP methyl ester carboxylesterase
MMTKTIFTTLIAMLLFTKLFAQNSNGLASFNNDYNLDFERMTNGDILPDNWQRFNPGVTSKTYKCEATTAEKHNGNQSVLIEQVLAAGPDAFGSVVNFIPAKYTGKDIEFKAWLKFENVRDYVAILIRINDANGLMMEFKTLEFKKINGTKDWAKYSVKASLPRGGQTICVSAILGGPGKLWVDDAQVLIDGKDISQAKINPEYNPNPPHYGNDAKLGRKITLKDSELYYEIYGEGQPLLLLHGNSQSIAAFTYQIADLAKKFKVIAVDTRGQGHSTDHSTMPLTYDLFADDMRQLLDSLHIPKANILGWSDGGNIGLIMAVKYPQYVNKLATMGANLFPTTDAVSQTTFDQVNAAISQLKLRDNDRAKKQLRLMNLLVTEPHLTFDQVKTIKCPVLVMAGEKDVILESHTRAIAAAIPKSKLLIFKGATHYAPVEIAKEFNASVISYLNR